MTADHLIGLDFGGMSIKGGAVREDGEVLARGSRPFEPDAPPEEIFARAADLVRELEEAAGGAAERVGLGCAGLFERSTGTVLASANMPNLVGQSLSEGVGRGLGGREVIVENDANVAAFGEQWLGAGREEDSMALLTLGTGVGGGIVLFDELFIGPGGNAGEIGHTVIFPRPSGSPFAGPYFEELACPCGSYGCLERLVSASAAKRRIAEAAPHAAKAPRLWLRAAEARDPATETAPSCRWFSVAEARTHAAADPSLWLRAAEARAATTETAPSCRWFSAARAGEPAGALCAQRRCAACSFGEAFGDVRSG